MTNHLQQLLEKLPEFNWFGYDYGKVDGENLFVTPSPKTMHVLQFSVPDLILDPRSNFVECFGKVWCSNSGHVYEDDYYSLILDILIVLWQECKGDPQEWAKKCLELLGSRFETK